MHIALLGIFPTEQVYTSICTLTANNLILCRKEAHRAREPTSAASCIAGESQNMVSETPESRKEHGSETPESRKEARRETVFPLREVYKQEKLVYPVRKPNDRALQDGDMGGSTRGVLAPSLFF